MTVRCVSLGATFTDVAAPVRALDGLDLTVEDREFVAVVGPSGCGKSTLLRLLAGLLRPTEGRVEFSGSASGHGDTAMVFQDHGLLPWLDLADNVALPLEVAGVGRAERRRRAGEVATRLGLAEFLDAYPHQLSGGMRQRGGIARALLADPAVLLMDEPFGALDAQTRIVLHEELLATWEQDRRSVVFVTHDIREAIQLADRIVVLSGRPGRVVGEFPVDLPRPRDQHASGGPEGERLRRAVWGLLEDEVRRHATR